MKTLTYETVERLEVDRPVDKYRWITGQCAGRDVLDLGCLDETELDDKRGTDWWLHGRISKVARRVLGVDNSDQVPDGGIGTGPNSRIVRGDVYRLGDLDLPFKPEVVVAGELIEHLPDPAAFLRTVRSVSQLTGAQLILTTPNASALYNALFGLCGRECQHRDHVAVQSYKTLHTICSRAGLVDWRVIPHTTRFPEMEVTARGARRLGVAAFTGTMNIVSSRFPLLAGGWIVDIRL